MDTIVSKTPVRCFDTISTTYHIVNNDIQTCQVSDLIVEEGLPKVNDEVLYQMKLMDDLEIYSDIKNREEGRKLDNALRNQEDLKGEYINDKLSDSIRIDDQDHSVLSRKNKKIEKNEMTVIDEKSEMDIILRKGNNVKDTNKTKSTMSINCVSSAIFKHGTKDKEKYKFYDEVNLSPINDNDILDFDSD